MKNKIIFGLAAIFIAITIIFAGILFSKEKNTQNKTENSVEYSETANEKIAFISITFDEESLDSLPSSLKEKMNGTELLSEEKAVIKEDESVYDFTTCFFEKNKIEFVASSGYFSSISGVDSGKSGNMSGWLLKLNGEIPMNSASDIKISENDRIEWHFTSDFSKEMNFND